MADELARIDDWLHDTLDGDTQLRAVIGAGNVYSEVAPAAAPHPCVVFAVLAPNDVLNSSGNRIMVEALYLVRAIDESDTWQGALKTAADRIDALLHLASGAPTGGTVFSSVRQRPHRLVEDDERTGKRFRHLGGEYLITIQVP